MLHSRQGRSCHELQQVAAVTGNIVEGNSELAWARSAADCAGSVPEAKAWPGCSIPADIQGPAAAYATAVAEFHTDCVHNCAKGKL